MKTVYIFAFVGSFTFAGCSQSTEKIDATDAKEQALEDSLAKVQAKEDARRDSLVAIEQDKVIGEIRFGMSEKEANRAINAFDDQNKKPRKIAGSTFYDQYIGEYEYSQILREYHNGGLYDVTIRGGLIHWEKYDSEVPRNVRFITDVIRQKFGAPDERKEIPERFRLQKGYTYLINSWDVGKKRIEVRVADIGTYYTVNVDIFHPEVRDAVLQSYQQKEKESADKAKDVF